ncbi:MAG: glycosyltransferase family 2 protein [Thaumarchaeota archaeon]|nr:glycosyltransferase family 2 protein [Nitrososphaerota archaeon]
MDEFPQRSKVSIIIPAYNEERTIREVVLKATTYGEVIVVDDGSIDRTAELAKLAGARVISHPRNMGQSAADRTGYLNSNREVVALIDADIQQVPEELPRVIRPILANQADMVIGSKYLGRREYQSNFPNMLMDRILGAILRARFGVTVTNPFSGMRAMRRTCIDFGYLKGDKHECAVELAFSFAWHGYRIMEVPRTARRRIAGRSSIRFTDGRRIIVRLLAVMLSPPKLASPRKQPSALIRVPQGLGS